MSKYHTQFEEAGQVIGTNLTTVTYRGTAAPSGYAPAYGTPAVKRRYCNFKCNSSGVPFRNLVSINAIDSDANRATVEVLGGFKKDDATVTDMTLALRGVGASGVAATEGYMARCELSGNIYISRRSSATAITTVATTTFTFSAGKSYFVRFRANGTSLKLRVWDAALGMAGEPTTWNIDTTDATYSAAGWVAFGGFGASADLVAPWNFIAVATNGDTAVCPRTNAEFATDVASQQFKPTIVGRLAFTGYDSGASPYIKTVYAYIANRGYMSREQDTPSNKQFDAIMLKVPTIRRQMGNDFFGPVATGYGDLQIANPRTTARGPGVRDDWLRLHPLRNVIELWLGSAEMPFHDFRRVLVGRLGQPIAPEADIIQFDVRDLTDFLNAPLVTSLFSTGAYDKQFKPKLYGRPQMFEPPQTDTTNQVYTITDGAFDGLGTAFDNNVHIAGPSGLTVSAANNANGDITASAAHGMVVNYRVQFTSGTPPFGLALNTDYYVISAGLTTTVFRLSLTVGGAAITGGVASTGAGFTGYGYRFDAAGGTMTLAAAPVGRVTVNGASSTAGIKGSDIVTEMVFTSLGLSLNYKDTTTFAAVAVEHGASSVQGGFWVPPVKTLGKDALPAVAAGFNLMYGFTLDGLMQLRTVGLPNSSASVLSLVESDVTGLRRPEVIRAKNSALAQVSYRPWFLTGGPLQTVTGEAIQGKTYYAQTAYTAASIPLDDNPVNLDLDTGWTVDLMLTNSTGMVFTMSSINSLFRRPLALEECESHLGALFHATGSLAVGDTIQLSHSRLGWKQWTGADDASPDNTGTVEARYAVVRGFEADLVARNVKLYTYRPIDGYFPTADLN